MGLSRFQGYGRHAYQHLFEGLRTIDSAIQKTALIYTLTDPLLRQSFDTRAFDHSLMAGFEKYQQARQLTSQIGGIIN